MSDVPDPGSDEGPPRRERFLHERLLGSVARAAAVALGLSPVSLFGLFVGADAQSLLMVHLSAFATTLPIFFFERRDAWRWAPVLVRAALAGALGATLALTTALWTSVAGDPGSAFGLFQGRVLSALPQLVGLALMVAACSPVWALPFLVRARTARPWPLLSAGLLLALALVTPVLAGERLPAKAVLGCGAVALAGLLAPLLVLVVEPRLRARGDPAAPVPAEGDPTRRFAVWGLLALLALLVTVPGLAMTMSHRAGAESSSIGSLKALLTAETVFAQGDKDEDGANEYAGNLGDLRDHGRLIDDVLASGVKYGYAYRVSRPAGEAGLERWAAAADPVALEGARRFWVDQAGLIFYTSSAHPPATLDSTGPPAGWVRLGR